MSAMTTVGRNMKIEVAEPDREAVRRFFCDVMGCDREEPMPALDLFLFADGFRLGVYYLPAGHGDVLTAAQYMHAPWIELCVDDVDGVTATLATHGVTPFDYVDRQHRYFQAPGGLVFRLAPRG